MKAVLQRVSEASVSVNGETPRDIGRGFLVLLGVARGDDRNEAEWLAAKISAMRVFEDSEGKMNLSVSDISGDVLVVSQFTLTASTRKGNRPSFDPAAPPTEAKPLYDFFVELIRQKIPGEVKNGEFGASMEVSLVNHGPVTIIMDSRNRE